MSARDRILGRVRAAIATREATALPGPFGAWRSVPYDGRAGPDPTAVDGFAAMLGAAGGEVVRVGSVGEAGRWLRDFAASFESSAVGETVPIELRPDRPRADPVDAPLGVSLARAAIAETGSLLMDARDGRRAQLLVPTHVVFVHGPDVHPTFHEALRAVRADLPSAIGLHSGPSKSADIGHVMVTGVHGPGRLVAVVIEPST